MRRAIIKRETVIRKKKSPTEFLYQPISFDFSTIKKVICNSLYKGSRVHRVGDDPLRTVEGPLWAPFLIGISPAAKSLQEG